MSKDKKVVIGFGSLNGDDQAGWLLIDKLEKQCSNDTNIFFKSKADGADWFPVVENAVEVLFVDAVKSGAAVGTVHMIKNQEECAGKFPASSHAISIFESIKLAEVLGYLNAPFLFYGIEIADNECTTEKVSQAINNLVDMLS